MKSIKYFTLAFLLSGAMSMQAMDQKLQATAMVALKMLHSEEMSMFYKAKTTPDKSTDGKDIVFPAGSTLPDTVRYNGVDFNRIPSDIKQYALDEPKLKEKREAINKGKPVVSSSNIHA